jgi:4-hydroxybenzoate polyprenyltransferase
VEPGHGEPSSRRLACRQRRNRLNEPAIDDTPSIRPAFLVLYHPADVIARGLLELLRPANVATALGDVLAGFAVAGLHAPRLLPWLLLSTACLYGGGVVLNDVFDRNLDRRERPERPIPSGRVPVPAAAGFGALLLAVGVIAAARVTTEAAAIAAAIAALVLAYDSWGKRYLAVAAVNMGLCRALNLMLGMAAVPAALRTSWWLAVIPLLYIAAVTILSRGEVHGGDRRVATVALISLSAALAVLTLTAAAAGARAVTALALVLVLTWRVLPPFLEARRTSLPGTIRAAVKRGVLSLVLVDAAIAAAYAGTIYAAAVVVTALMAGWLARRFAVT